MSHKCIGEANQKEAYKEVPGPRGHRLIGSLRAVRQDRLQFVMQATREYGDIVRFSMGPKQLYLLNHPNYVKHVLCDNQENYRKGLGLIEARPLFGNGLLTSEGTLWAYQRRLMQPAFRSVQMERISTTIIKATSFMLNQWKVYAGTNQVLDIYQEMSRLTLCIIGSALFRTDLSEVADDLIAHFTLLTRWAMSRMTAGFTLPLSVPTPRHLQVRRAQRQLDLLVEKMVKNHSQEPDHTSDDLLSLLMSSDNANIYPIHKQQLRDEVLTLLLAGHETAAATLAWTWYLLAQHPEVENQLHQELERVLSGREPSLSDLSQLVYTKRLVQEVLRLYPPVWIIPRKALSADHIEGYHIPAAADVLLCVYSLHRHAAFWPEPDRFDPDRFPEASSSQHLAHAYLPFGAGPRACIGSRLGLIEVMLILALVAQRHHLKLVTSQTVEPEASLTLRPHHGPGMRIVDRHSRLRT